jgi:hypothetical protein
MLRPCLEPGCPRLTRGTRCQLHTRSHDLVRQARRGDRYLGDWPAISKAQREAIPYCENCGSTEDLTADHYRGGTRTLCRSCNRPDAIRDRQQRQRTAVAP